MQKVYEYDFDPKAPKQEVHRFNGNRGEGPSNFYGMPVFQDGIIYLAGGGDVFWGKNEAWLKAVRADNTGTFAKDAEVWAYALEKHVLSSPAIHDGMVFIADTSRNIHCVDQKTGKTN